MTDEPDEYELRICENKVKNLESLVDNLKTDFSIKYNKFSTLNDKLENSLNRYLGEASELLKDFDRIIKDRNRWYRDQESLRLKQEIRQEVFNHINYNNYDYYKYKVSSGDLNEDEIDYFLEDFRSNNTLNFITKMKDDSNSKFYFDEFWRDFEGTLNYYKRFNLVIALIHRTTKMDTAFIMKQYLPQKEIYQSYDILCYRVVDFKHHSWYLRYDLDNKIVYPLRKDHANIPNLILRNFHLPLMFDIKKGRIFNSKFKHSPEYLLNQEDYILFRYGHNDKEVIYSEKYAIEFDYYINYYSLPRCDLYKNNMIMRVSKFNKEEMFQYLKDIVMRLYDAYNITCKNKIKEYKFLDDLVIDRNEKIYDRKMEITYFNSLVKERGYLYEEYDKCGVTMEERIYWFEWLRRQKATEIDYIHFDYSFDMYKLIYDSYKDPDEDEAGAVKEYVQSHHARCDLTKEMFDVDDNNYVETNDYFINFEKFLKRYSINITLYDFANKISPRELMFEDFNMGYRFCQKFKYVSYKFDCVGKDRVFSEDYDGYMFVLRNGTITNRNINYDYSLDYDSYTGYMTRVKANADIWSRYKIKKTELEHSDLDVLKQHYKVAYMVPDAVKMRLLMFDDAFNSIIPDQIMQSKHLRYLIKGADEMERERELYETHGLNNDNNRGVSENTYFYEFYPFFNYSKIHSKSLVVYAKHKGIFMEPKGSNHRFSSEQQYYLTFSNLIYNIPQIHLISQANSLEAMQKTLVYIYMNYDKQVFTKINSLMNNFIRIAYYNNYLIQDSIEVFFIDYYKGSFDKYLDYLTYRYLFLKKEDTKCKLGDLKHYWSHIGQQINNIFYYDKKVGIDRELDKHLDEEQQEWKTNFIYNDLLTYSNVQMDYDSLNFIHHNALEHHMFLNFNTDVNYNKVTASYNDYGCVNSVSVLNNIFHAKSNGSMYCDLYV